MAIENGSAFLLKIGDGAGVPAYRTVAGLRTTQLSVNGEAVNVTTKDSGGWRELLAGAGVRSVSVSAAGIFTGSDAEVRLRGQATNIVSVMTPSSSCLCVLVRNIFNPTLARKRLVIGDSSPALRRCVCPPRCVQDQVPGSLPLPLGGGAFSLS